MIDLSKINQAVRDEGKEQPKEAPMDAAIEKKIRLKTKFGEELTMPISLTDPAATRQSAAEWLFHVYQSAKQKMDEPMLFTGKDVIDPNDKKRMEEFVIYIGQFHDAVFGTFNSVSKLPDQERADFIEFFFLAIANVFDDQEIHIDLPKGEITTRTSLN